MRNAIAIPCELKRVEQYFGPWASEPSRFRQMMESVAQTDLVKHAAAYEARGEIGAYRKQEDAAVIDIVGTMTKYGSSMSQMLFGTIGVRKAIRRAVADPSVKRIILSIYSSGGTVDGTGDLADEVRNASKEKPVIAYLEDICASAAYWVASQADVVYASPHTQVGSIGVYMVVNDESVAAETAGVKTHVISTAELKGAGVPGAPVTDAQLAEWQRQINSIHEDFKSAIMRGRKMTVEQFEAVSTGGVWDAAKAKKLRLVDRILSFSQLFGNSSKRLVVQTGKRGAAAQRRTMMSDFGDEGGAPSVAEYVETLKANCPGAKAEWLLQKAVDGADLSEATAEHYQGMAEANAALIDSNGVLLAANQEQEEEIGSLRNKLSEAEAKCEVLEAEIAHLKSGTPTLQAATSAPQASTAKAALNALTNKRMADTNESWQQAWWAVLRNNPELRDQLLREANGQEG